MTYVKPNVQTALRVVRLKKSKPELKTADSWFRRLFAQRKLQRRERNV